MLHSFSLFLSPSAHLSACLLSTVHSTLQPCAPLWLGWQGFRFTQLIISSTQARPTVRNTSCLSDQGHCTEDRGREKGQWVMDGGERKGKEKEVETDGQREIEGWAEGGDWRQRQIEGDGSCWHGHGSSGFAWLDYSPILGISSFFPGGFFCNMTAKREIRYFHGKG